MLGAARAGREWEHARVCTCVPGAGVSVWVRSECRAGRDAGRAQGGACRAVTRGSTPTWAERSLWAGRCTRCYQEHPQPPACSCGPKTDTGQVTVSMEARDWRASGKKQPWDLKPKCAEGVLPVKGRGTGASGGGLAGWQRPGGETGQERGGAGADGEGSRGWGEPEPYGTPMRLGLTLIWESQLGLQGAEVPSR